MFDNVDDIFKCDHFDSRLIYYISGRALAEIIMRLQEQDFYIEELEKEIMGIEIDWSSIIKKGKEK